MGQRMPGDENQHHLERKVRIPKIPEYQEVRMTVSEPDGAIKAAAASATNAASPIARMNGSGMKRSNRSTENDAKLRRRCGAAVTFRAHAHAPSAAHRGDFLRVEARCGKISSVCSPSFGAGLRQTPGVCENRGTILGIGMRSKFRILNIHEHAARLEMRISETIGDIIDWPGGHTRRLHFRDRLGTGTLRKPAPMISSIRARFFTRASLVAKRGSVTMSGRPMISKIRRAVAAVEPDSAA